jgi:hypothetical protein
MVYKFGIRRFLCLKIVYISLGVRKPLKIKNLQPLKVYKIGIYGVQNWDLWCTKLGFMVYKIGIYDRVIHMIIHIVIHIGFLPKIRAFRGLFWGKNPNFT